MNKSFLYAFYTIFLFTIIHPTTYPPNLFAAFLPKTILAKVNGEIIDQQDLEDRLKTIHKTRIWMRPKARTAQINVLDIVEQMIDERLMIQEALKLELDKENDFMRKMKLFKRVQAILRLKKEEVDDKITITDKEINDYFEEHYNNQKGIDEKKVQRLKNRIKKKLRKQKEKDLSENFFALLRKKAKIWIDKKLVNSVDPDKVNPDKGTIVARVNGKPVYFDDFIHDLKKAIENKKRLFKKLKDKEKQEKYKLLKKEVLDRLITYELIEQEALKRMPSYMKDSNFVAMIKKRKEALLVEAFKAKLIYPLASPTKDELTQYYKENIDKFRLSNKVWFTEMSFAHQQEAKKVHDELKQGADFEFLAALMSEDSASQKDYIWVRADRFSPPVRKALNRLKEGEVSDIIHDRSQYKIIKLKGKKKGEPIEFSSVLEKLKKIVTQKKFDDTLAAYLKKLRQTSEIKIYQKAIKQIEDKYFNTLPGKTKNATSAG